MRHHHPTLPLRRAALAVLLGAVAVLGAPTDAAARTRLKSLDIRVELADNGDARISETRRMTIDGEGTECYIVVGNMRGSKVRDLSVSDETGATYENVGAWDTDWSRSRKDGRCGIVETSDGYELCWGLGDEGSRTYTTTYTVTRLCRAYDDADGFNYMFVAQDIEPRPERARVTIVREGTDGGFSADDTQLWAFRYDGDVVLRRGAIVAQADDGLQAGQAIIVMVQLEKGVLHPAKHMDGSFDDVKDEAFEQSDYDSGALWAALLALAILLCPFVVVGIYALRKRKLRREMTRDLTWYRDVPCNGNLVKANQVLNAYRYFNTDKQHLINAGVLRLISMGALRIENHFVAAGMLQRMAGNKGKNRDCIVIGELTAERGQAPGLFLKTLYNMFRDAAGDDRILQPGELKKWMRRNTDRLVEFVHTTGDKMTMKQVRASMDQARQVMGMKRFLKEFTLANERHLTELALWKDYLVYAELFGIADQVRADMQRLNPEYLRMEKVYRDLMDRDVVPELMLTTLYGQRLAQRAISRSRSDGGGGSASLLGGGGFSGGGSGGGVR